MASNSRNGKVIQLERAVPVTLNEEDRARITMVVTARNNAERDLGSFVADTRLRESELLGAVNTARQEMSRVIEEVLTAAGVDLKNERWNLDLDTMVLTRTS